MLRLDDMINDLSLCLKPVIKYIQEELMAKLYETKENEKSQMIVHRDYVNGVLQKDNKKAVHKQNIKFEFNKENFFRNHFGCYCSGGCLGIIELIKFLFG